ncbi:MULTISPECIES: hypothetical protein [unclassified Streptomyces]
MITGSSRDAKITKLAKRCQTRYGNRKVSASAQKSATPGENYAISRAF